MKYMDWAAMGMASGAYGEASSARAETRELWEENQRLSDELGQLQDNIDQLQDDISHRRRLEEYQNWIEEFIYKLDKVVTQISSDSEDPVNDCVVIASYLNIIHKNSLDTSRIRGLENKSAFEQAFLKAQNLFEQLEKIPEVQKHLRQQEEARLELERLRGEERKEAEKALKEAMAAIRNERQSNQSEKPTLFSKLRKWLGRGNNRESYDAETQIDYKKESFGKSFSDRIDYDLPLGLRFNCLVEIPEVDFILAGSDLLIKDPGSDCSVVSFGIFVVGDSMAYRFYLNSSVGPYMLQIVADRKKVVEECKLFMPYDEVFPADHASWAFWLAEENGYIGLSIFDTKTSVRFFRVWENPDAVRVLEPDASGAQLDRIPPEKFFEKIYLDPYGEKTETVTYDTMLYGRQVNENVDEYLMISAVDQSDIMSLQIMVGIELAPSSIRVI